MTSVRSTGSTSPIRLPNSAVNTKGTAFGPAPVAGRLLPLLLFHNTATIIPPTPRALVDTTVVDVVGSNAATTLQQPTYVNGVLTSQFLLLQGTGTGTGTTTTTGGVILIQELSLYRATCRIHWRIVNTDSVPHTATLRFVVNVRGSESPTGSPTTGQGYYNSGFYFQDPNRGVSNAVTILPQVPDQLNIYGRRFEEDLNSTTNITSPPFAARHTFRGFGATPPSQVYVTNPAELNPAVAGTFAPGIP